MSEDWCGGEGLLKGLKGALAGGRPVEVHIAFSGTSFLILVVFPSGQGYERPGEVRESLDEPSIEVREAEEGLYVFYSLRGFPF